MLTMRRGESVLLTIGIPVGLLLFFSGVDLGFIDAAHPVDFLAPGITLAAANGLYLVLLLLGGMVVPLAKLPGPVRFGARVLPAAALSDVLHASIGTGGHVRAGAWLVLVVWAVVAPAAAAVWFSW